MTAPFDMIVLGGTGDLARRKLLPSLYYLHKDERISKDGRIIGVARHEHSQEEFLARVEEGCRQEIRPEDFDEKTWNAFARRLSYFSAPDSDAACYKPLGKILNGGGGDVGRIRAFYLATSPTVYGQLAHAVGEAGLTRPDSRIVLEKPIGHDLKSAAKINSDVGEIFREDQIYRIDHYLGKETVQNLMVLRFANVLFEPLWRAQYIDHVQITVAERLGMEGRGDYYDTSGALRDMVQNHLLQLLCLVAMEPPARLETEVIREEKIKVLRSLRPILGSDLAANTVRAQYRDGVVAGEKVRGFLEEPGIRPKSRTETFVALKAEIDNWRWAGVPFYLRTGKRMAYRVSEIIIQFKSVPHPLFGDRLGAQQDNRLIIRLQPDESIRLATMVKKPGSAMSLKPVHLNLNLADTFDDRTPLAYERLLLDVLKGSATLFMHRREVEAAWRWVEPILEGWDALGGRPRSYAAGTWGPEESIALMVRDERSWYEHLA
ncbi:MAG: glucose-6-phosphate dehydrogenase [Acidobacteriota bacterium]